MSEARARLRARVQTWNLGKTGSRFVRPRSETRLLYVGMLDAMYVAELKKGSFLRNRPWMEYGVCVDVWMCGC